MTLNAIQGKPLPIYGSGENIRDWLHVEDHCEAIYDVLTRGRVGETYNVGGRSERNNITIVTKICEILDELRPRKDGKSYKKQITHVADRMGMTFATQSTARRSSGNLAGRRSISLKMGSAKQLSGISITVNGLSPFRPVNTRTGLRLITAAETNCPEGADCGKQQE